MPAPPRVVTMPILAFDGTPDIGSNLAFTEPTYVDTPDEILYTLTRDGVPVVGATDVTIGVINAYAQVAEDIGRHLAIVAKAYGPNGVAVNYSNTIKMALEDAIEVLYTSASWLTRAIYLARPDAMTESAGAVSALAQLSSGVFGDVIQATPAAQPLWSPTGSQNGGPTLLFNGSRGLRVAATANLSAGGSASVLTVVGRSDRPSSGTRGFGGVDPAAGVTSANRQNNVLSVASLALNSFNAQITGNVGGVLTRGPYSTDVSVLSCTGDYGLATNEVELRRNGINITTTRVTNNNNTDTGYSTLSHMAFGCRTDGSGILFPIVGEMAALVFAQGAGPIPTATLSLVEGLLQKAYNERSYV